MTISANIICKNEIENIVKCINSVLPYCNEIIVVDTGSTDGTIEAIKSIGNSKIKLFYKEWNDNFADMRNFALEKSKGDFILALDADMALKTFEYEQGADYYVCNVQISGDEENVYNLPITLFFRNNGARYYGARHATIEKDIVRLGGIVRESNITLSHPKISATEIRAKMAHNLKVHLEQLKTEPDNETVFYHLCRTYYYLGYYNEAIKYGIKTLAAKVNREVKATAALLIYLVYNTCNMDKYGIQYLMYSLELIPRQVFGRYFLMKHFQKINRKLALDTYEELEAISKSGKSDLPADIIFNDKQLNKIKGDL